MTTRIKAKLGSAYLMAFFSSFGFSLLIAGEKSVFGLFDTFESLPVVQHFGVGILWSLMLGAAVGLLHLLTPDKFEHYLWKFVIGLCLGTFLLFGFANGPGEFEPVRRY